MKIVDGVARAHELLSSRRPLLAAGKQAESDAAIAEARRLLNGILGRRLDDPGVLFLLGSVELEAGNFGLATVLLHKTLQIKPDFFEALNNLGAALKAENHDDLARLAWTKALSLNQADPALYANLATLHINNGTPEDAARLARRALELDPSLTDAHFTLALSLLEQGRWREGWPEYEYGSRNGKRADRNYWAEGRTPRWDGSEGKTVVVYGEQGVGDEVMFASCLPSALGEAEEIIFDCHPRLAKIFQRSFGVECHGTRKQDLLDWPADRQIDACIPIGSLPGLFGVTAGSSRRGRYLSADPKLVEKWRARLGPNKLNVGISWRGGGLKTRMDLRSVPLPAWRPILDTPGVNFVSLQYHDDAGEDAAEVGLTHWPEANADLDEQFALIEALDLVISVCTSVVHFAGALGKPCWVLTPSRPAWRYGVSGPMPWYVSVNLYRQAGDDWASVINQIGGDLADFARVPQAERAVA